MIESFRKPANTTIIENEPLFKERPHKFCLLPITKEFQHFYDFHKKLEANYWVVAELDFKGDQKDWNKLDNDSREFIENILAFFAGGDFFVEKTSNIFNELFDDIPEIKMFYSYQMYNEAVHMETYSLLIDNLITDEDRKKTLFESFTTMPHITNMYNWVIKNINRTIEDEYLLHPELDRDNIEDQGRAFLTYTYKFILSMAAFECIGFSGAFAAIFWIKEKGILNALTQSNLLIARDEGAHVTFATMILDAFVTRPPAHEIVHIVSTMVDAAKEIMAASIDKLMGLNKDMMFQYIEFVADGLLDKVHVPRIYNVELPSTMSFMNKISYDSFANFFEKKSVDYALGGFQDADCKGDFISDDF